MLTVVDAVALMPALLGSIALLLARLGLLAEPQPAITIALDTTTTAIGRR